MVPGAWENTKNLRERRSQGLGLGLYKIGFLTT